MEHPPTVVSVAQNVSCLSRSGGKVIPLISWQDVFAHYLLDDSCRTVSAMAYASLFENITERLLEAKESVDAQRVRKKGTAHERANLKEAAARAQSLLHELIEALDLATDPSVDLAAKVRSVRIENSRLAGDLQSAKSEAKRFQIRLLEANGKIRSLQKHVVTIEKQYKTLELTHEKLLRKCPSEMYALYSSPSRISKFRPDEQ